MNWILELLLTLIGIHHLFPVLQDASKWLIHQSVCNYLLILNIRYLFWTYVCQGLDPHDLVLASYLLCCYAPVMRKNELLCSSYALSDPVLFLLRGRAASDRDDADNQRKLRSASSPPLERNLFGFRVSALTLPARGRSPPPLLYLFGSILF